MTPDAGDALEVDALRTDRYLDALLGAHDRGSVDVPADAALDPAVRSAAWQLARQLARVHPSFRFEERLAARLAEAARTMRLAPAAGGTVDVPLPIPITIRTAGSGQLVELYPRDIRPFLIGGALTSAALSLAGAAWVAWRRTHQPPRSPMARAVRAARGTRAVRRLS